MPDLTRRFFLGGAISLVAATTFLPTIQSNMPTIYGNGKDDDTGGLGALLRNEPVIFSKDQIGISDHKGLIFHKGTFVISNTINIPANTIIDIEQNGYNLEFIGKDLPNGFAFFHCEDFSGHGFSSKVGIGCIFSLPRGHSGQLITYAKRNFDEVL